MKETCQQAFQAGCDQRRHHPLHSGVYKLEECRHWVQSFLDEIERIAVYKRNQADKYSLVHCTPDDAAHWLKNLPAFVAHCLGHDVLPAIGALSADGVPPNDVTRLQRDALHRADQLVATLETARRIISGPIKTEYDHMKAGYSTLAPVIGDVLAMIESVLSRAAHTCGPVRNSETGALTRPPAGSIECQSATL